MISPRRIPSPRAGHLLSSAALFALVTGGCGEQFSPSGGAAGSGVSSSATPAASGGGGATSGSSTGGSSTGSTTGGDGGTGGFTASTSGATTTTTETECVACYQGPDGTKGVGACTSGCLEGEVCTGQVLPTVENCGTADDESCDGVGCTGDVLWARSIGGSGAIQLPNQIVADPAGATVFVGAFGGNLGVSNSAGGSDIVIAKTTPDGFAAWTKTFGDALDQSALGVASNSTGPLVVGSFQGSVFGVTSAGGTDAFLTQLNQDGGVVWSKRYGGAEEQLLKRVAVDSQGNIVVAGSFSGTINFGPTSLTSQGQSDVVVAKLTPMGDPLWSKRFGDAVLQEAADLTIDKDGNILLVGVTQGSVDFGGGLLTSAGGNDIFLVKLSANGDHLWSKIFGDSASQWGHAVAVNSAGDVHIAATVVGKIQFGSNPLQSAGQSDAAVAKFDSSGNHKWSALFGDASAQFGKSLAVDGAGNVTFTGNMAGAMTVGGITLVSAGLDDAFVVKLAPNGNPAWAKVFGDSNFQVGIAVAAGADGSAFVGGSYNGSVAFGPTMFLSAGADDIFLVKLAP
ncbi:MAG: hypothetical protein IPK82_40305 [Polyangiaceae bacterium]|nr:hypothetical protein [Polyangiaceae bacterium]